MITASATTGPFEADLRALQRRMSNLRPVLKEMGAVLENAIRDRRDTLTDPNGLSWQPWSASTRATYPANGRGKLMDRTGQMWDRPGPEWQATADTLRVGFAELYATYHEFGTRYMPRRGLLFADPETGSLGAADEQALRDVLEDWINGTVVP